MGNSLEAPVTEKDTVRFERAGSAVKAERHDGHKGPDKEIVRRAAPGDDFMDGIAAAACSMQGWRCSMEDRLCARMDLEGRPLGAHHIFCLFDGHGGDSVAEYCQVHLADRIVRRIQNAHDLRSAAAAAAAGVTSKSSEEGNTIRRDTGAGRSSGGKGPRGCGVPVDSDVSLVTDCVREACREVDKEVKELDHASCSSNRATRPLKSGCDLGMASISLPWPCRLERGGGLRIQASSLEDN